MHGAVEAELARGGREYEFRGCAPAEVSSGPQKQTPAFGGGLGRKTLAMTYSRMRLHTTIGAAAFHFRVRDGIGWFHSAMFTRERVEGRGQVGFWPCCRAHALMGMGRNKVLDTVSMCHRGWLFLGKSSQGWLGCSARTPVKPLEVI
jgi:hypothetical protein